MILSDFKSNNVKRRTKNDLKKQVEVIPFFNNTIKKVLMFVDDSTDVEMLKLIKEDLNIENINSQIILYKEKIDKDTNYENCISKKDFGIFGNFKNQNIKKAVGLPIDLLINYVSNNTYLNNLAVKSNANFKVGFIDANKHIYDLMIDVKKNDYTTFNNELKKYLKILNKI